VHVNLILKGKDKKHLKILALIIGSRANTEKFFHNFCASNTAVGHMTELLILK
jgi:hypothetical protein